MTKIKFENIEINEIKDTSGVFSGENMPINWRHTKKSAMGFGKVEGDHNKINGNISIVKKES